MLNIRENPDSKILLRWHNIIITYTMFIHEGIMMRENQARSTQDILNSLALQAEVNLGRTYTLPNNTAPLSPQQRRWLRSMTLNDLKRSLQSQAQPLSPFQQLLMVIVVKGITDGVMYGAAWAYDQAVAKGSAVSADTNTNPDTAINPAEASLSAPDTSNGAPITTPNVDSSQFIDYSPSNHHSSDNTVLIARADDTPTNTNTPIEITSSPTRSSNIDLTTPTPLSQQAVQPHPSLELEFGLKNESGNSTYPCSPEIKLFSFEESVLTTQLSSTTKVSDGQLAVGLVPEVKVSSQVYADPLKNKLDAKTGVSGDAKYLDLNTKDVKVKISSHAKLSADVSAHANNDSVGFNVDLEARMTAVQSRVEAKLGEVCNETLNTCVQVDVVSESNLGTVGGKVNLGAEHNRKTGVGQGKIGLGVEQGAVGVYKGLKAKWRPMKPKQPASKSNSAPRWNPTKHQLKPVKQAIISQPSATHRLQK